MTYRTIPTISVIALLGLVSCGDNTKSELAVSNSTLATIAASDTTATTGATATTAATATTSATSNMAEAVRNLAWGDNVTITIDETAGTWTISGNGRPDQDLPAQYLIPKAGVDARTVTLDILEVGATSDQEVPFTWTLPLEPQLAAGSTSMFGAVAVASSGGYINDPYEADQATIALESNFVIDGIGFIDDCNGHFNPMGYHYHGIPTCITAEIDQPGQHSSLLGFAIDGFPVYGPQDTDGNEVTDLDDCQGHFGPTPEFPGGVYHYHLTTTFPYTTLCLSGTPAVHMNH